MRPRDADLVYSLGVKVQRRPPATALPWNNLGPVQVGDRWQELFVNARMEDVKKTPLFP